MYIIFLCPSAKGYDTKRVRKKPPPDDGYTYIKAKNAAIPNKGIAAFFVSTGIYVLAVITILCNDVQHSHTVVFVNPCAFLFTSITDKPHNGRPRCRSPPLLLASEILKKGGRAMSSDKKRYILIDGEKVYVSEEVYREYYRPMWREVKRRRVRLKFECSLEVLTESGVEFADGSILIADAVEDKIMSEKLRAVLAGLTDDERFMVDFLFVQGKSERELSAITGIPQKTINYRRKKLLAKLRKRLNGF